MTKREFAIDVAIVDFGGEIDGFSATTTEVAASELAHQIHLRALRDLGPSSEPCVWSWYAYDGGEDHDRKALAAGLVELDYPPEKINDLLMLWDAAERPVVGVHQQSVIAKRPN